MACEKTPVGGGFGSDRGVRGGGGSFRLDDGL